MSVSSLVSGGGTNRSLSLELPSPPCHAPSLLPEVLWFPLVNYSIPRQAFASRDQLIFG